MYLKIVLEMWNSCYKILSGTKLFTSVVENFIM